MSYTIRTYGDPVLKTVASQVDDVNGKIIRLVDDMFDTLVDSGNGIALAAPQIGVQKQVVVWDIDEHPLAIINPEIVESDGEWVYDEGCLSIPDSTSRCCARRRCSSAASTSNGEIIEIEADELEARMFQHEIDHLNGVLMFDRLEGDQRKEAMKEYRRIEQEAARQAPRSRSAGDSASDERSS
jgi:peptide deformylase